MKRFLILALSFFTSLNLSAAPISAYLSANSNDLIQLFLDNPADQHNLVILELVGHRLGLNYQDLIDTRLSEKHDLILTLAQTLTLTQAPHVSTPTTLTSFDNLVEIEKALIELKIKSYIDLIQMSLQEKIDLLKSKPTGVSAGSPATSVSISPVSTISASPTPPPASRPPSGMNSIFGSITGGNPRANLKKPDAASAAKPASESAKPADTKKPMSLVDELRAKQAARAKASGDTSAPAAPSVPTTTASDLPKPGKLNPSAISGLGNALAMRPAASTTITKPATSTPATPSAPAITPTTGVTTGTVTGGAGAGVGPNARIILDIVQDLTPQERSALLSYPDSELSNVVNRIDSSIGGKAAGGITKPFMIKSALNSTELLTPYAPPVSKTTSTAANPKTITPARPKPISPVTKTSVADFTKLTGLSKYEALLSAGRSDQEILANLLAPASNSWATDPLKMRTDISRIPNDTSGMTDINSHEILDFLLQRKFNQQPSTTEQMNIADKIVDVVRRLANDPTITMTLPKVAGRRPWIEFPQPGTRSKVKIMNCVTRKLEEQERSARHLDYNISGDNTVYLLNRHKFYCDHGTADIFNDSITNVGDHSVISHYGPGRTSAGWYTVPANVKIVNYYWTQDGQRFLLVYSDGSSQLFNWEDGSPIGDPIPASTPEPVTRAGRDKQDKPIQVDGETRNHFFARRIAILDTSHGAVKRDNSPDFNAAMAIQALDSTTFNELSDDMVALLKKPEEFDHEIPTILLQEPNAASTLDKAKVYIAIASGSVKPDNPNYNKWKTALDKIEADALKAGTGNAGLAPSEAFGRTISKFSLNDEQMNILKAPSRFKNRINGLLTKDLSSTELIDQAEIYYAILVGMVNSSDPNLDKWKKLLGII